VGEDIQVHGADAFQGGEGMAAGDQHAAASAGRQQGTDLLGVAGVVQQHQQPPPGGQRPEPGGRLLDLGGDLGGVQAERTQQTAKRLQRVHGCQPGGGAVQVDVQLPVWEVVGELVGHLDRQRGLADATHPVDRADHHRSVQPGSRCARVARTADLQQAKQRRQLAAPTGEVRRRAGQLPRNRQATSPRWPARCLG
jgi:hypothetical protein